MSDKLKQCSQCGKPLPATSDYFYMRKNPSGAMVPISRCKACHCFSVIIYWDKHRGERLDYAKAYREKNKERIKQRRKAK